jgi:two-component system, NarL family, sensor histidine kinase UhpB
VAIEVVAAAEFRALSALESVVVIDDSEVDAALLEARLKQLVPGLQRFRWFPTQDGVVEALAADPPDLVVCDYHMAGQDTLGTIRRIRQAQPLLPLLVMSGLVGEESAVEVLKEGASDFLAKSRPERLALVIDRLMREGRERQDQAQVVAQAEEQRRLLSAVFAQATIGLWQLDKVGRIVSANDCARRMMGGLLSVRVEEFGVFEGWWMDTGRRIEDGEWPAAVAFRERRPVEARLMQVRTLTGQLKVFDCSACPLVDDQGELLGALIIASDETDAHDLRQRLGRAEDELRSLSHAQLLRLEDHMASVARDLHDDIGQILSLVRMRLSASEHAGWPLRRRLQEVREALPLVDHAIQRLRGICTDLRPAELMDFGLAEGIRVLLARIPVTLGIQTTFVETGEPWRACPGVDLAFYRVTQQAVTNSLQHARARNLCVRVLWQGDMARLEIEDDGSGFDDGAVARPGHGLRSMRDRMSMLGGALHFEQPPGGGTIVCAIVRRAGLPVSEAAS